MRKEELLKTEDYLLNKSIKKSNFNKDILNKEQEQIKKDKELLESFRKKDNLISNKDLKHFKEMINENKKDFLVFLKEKNYLEKNNDDSYKMKDNILKRENFEDLLWDYDFENSIFSEIRDTTFRKNFTDEELLDRYNIKRENFIIYSQNEDKLYDSESSLSTRDLEEYIINLKSEEYWDNLKLNDVKSWDNLLKEKLVIGEIKKTSEKFESFEEYTGTHLEEIAIYTMMETKLLFGEVRQDLIRNSEKELISEEKVEMLENRYSNFEEKNKEKITELKVEREDYLEDKKRFNYLNEKTKENNFNFSIEKLQTNIKEYQKDIIEDILTNRISKISDTEYKFDEEIDFSTKRNWEVTCQDYGSGLFRTMLSTMGECEIYDRYDILEKLPNFQVVVNENIIYDSASKENDINKIENYVLSTKGQEFWDNMNLKYIQDWNELPNATTFYKLPDYVHTFRYENFEDYSDNFEDLILNEDYQKDIIHIKEKVRLDLLENSNDNIITKDNILKLAKEYNCLNEVKNSIEEKTKEIEKINDREID